ncbi:MAG: hypothetical protein WD845_17575 [Pirellulales bacterium]
MRSQCAHRARRAGRRHCLTALAVAALSVFLGGFTRANDIDRVEEDWRLVVSEPDTLLVSPQVTCTMSPEGNLDSDYAVFDLNLRNFPSYEAGGVQLQVWNGDNSVSSIRSKSGVVLAEANEVITWTQSMSVQDHKVSFAVTNGQSTSWGSFGDGNSIELVKDTDLQNLNGYSPQLTVDNSGVGYGANRVATLTLVAIRLYSGPTLVAQVTDPQAVYPQP